MKTSDHQIAKTATPLEQLRLSLEQVSYLLIKIYSYCLTENLDLRMLLVTRY